MATAATKAKKPSAAARITNFLKSNPEGPLRIATGYASFWGLAWLSERCEERSEVDILIGDCGARNFLKAGENEIEKTLAFIERDGVNIWELEKGSRSRVHSKVWVADRSVLSGSANLTKQGLYRNAEAMGEYRGVDRYQAFKQVHSLIASASRADFVLEAYAEYLAEQNGR